MADENDVVLIHFEDKPLAFARIEDITADQKPGWYHVKLLLLQIPLQVVSWILRDVYIDGETFTMGGKRMRLEKVVCPEPEKASEEDALDPPSDRKGGKVISLTALRRNLPEDEPA
jgi:hypothetical protein